MRISKEVERAAIKAYIRRSRRHDAAVGFLSAVMWILVGVLIALLGVQL